jgi:ankyrin repeat protein
VAAGHGADVNPKEKRGSTPLHFAAENGHLDVCRILLKCNADVDSQKDDGSTPLHQASRRGEEGSTAIVRLLLEYSADVRVRDDDGKTASNVALGAEREQIVQLLSQHASE